jgi:4-hydroxy-2-oxoheptanedioate aldolase
LLTYLEERNAGSIAVANIESVPAIENLDELLAIEGLDAVLIGPHDLSCSLGIPEQYADPRFDQAVRTIFSKARAAGKGAGIHYFQEGIEAEVEWVKAGGNFIVHAGDVHFYRQTLQREIGALRKTLGDERTSGGDSVII